MDGWIVDGVKCIGYQISAVAKTVPLLIGSIGRDVTFHRGIISYVLEGERRRMQDARCTMYDVGY